MARGPFQGTYRPGVRPTVVTAPDALVYINGESDLIGCPQCKRKFDLNKYITSVQVDLNVDSPPGSASINLSVPRHTIDDLYFDGNLLLVPMMEVEIYAKGYYLIEGLPQYYPIFWGMITEVSDSYSGGEHSISINCSDILKWWELCKMNINPAFTQPEGSQGRNIFGNVFFGMNPYDIIWTLAQQAFGDVVVGSGSLTSFYKEPTQKQTFATALGDIQRYWQQRFGRMRSNLLLYGTSGATVRGDVLYDQYQNGRHRPAGGRPWASAAIKRANGGRNAGQMVFDPTDKDVVAFRTQFSQAGQVNFWQSEYQTKLELANAAKDCIGFEFYMDVDGSIVFKPPFYNLDVLPNKPVSWIQDIDIIDWDFSESEAEVVTQILVQGNMGGGTDYGFGEETTPFTSVTDYHLLRKYGWRQQTFNSEFMSDPQLMFYVGMDMLDRYNSRRHRGTVNIPLRPELRLGFPVYIAPKDQFWYVQGISHNIQFGGRAQTTLTLTAKRQKFVSPRGIGEVKITSIHTDTKNPKNNPITALAEVNKADLTPRDLSQKVSFEVTVGNAAQLPPQLPEPGSQETGSSDDPYAPLILRHPKTGRIVGYPNVVMAYTRPFDAPPERIQRTAGQSKERAKRAQRVVKEFQQQGQAQLDDIAKSSAFSPEDAIRDEQLTHRYQYGLNSSGVYTYCYDTSKKIQEIIFPQRSRVIAKVSGEEDPNFFGKGKKGSAMIRPVSDERGFEVIGHFRYGRGVYLRDGSLILNEETGVNEGAHIDTQTALAGGMFEMLSAQSQGISAVTTQYPNPAEAIARLQPEELQTAGRINPETKKPEFNVDTEGKTLIQDTAPLGTINQKGVGTVESSQLSRALTLAEMTVKEGVVPNDECVCLLGRSDLAFINQGYQVKTLFNTSTAADQSVLPTPGTIQDGPTTATVVDLQAERDRLQGQLENDPAILAGLDLELGPSLQRRIAEIDQAIANANSLTSGDGTRPVDGFVTPSGEQLALTVESFLVNLYSVLDGDHQEWEKALRGELISQGNVNPNDVRFGQGFTPSGPTPAYAPPFNAPNRALGGDPAAIAASAKSNIGDIQKVWSDFGDNLNSNTKRTKLEKEIGVEQKRLERLEAEQQDLEDFLSNEGNRRVQPVWEGDPEQQLADVNKQISATQQRIARKQNELNTI